MVNFLLRSVPTYPTKNSVKRTQSHFALIFVSPGKLDLAKVSICSSMACPQIKDTSFTTKIMQFQIILNFTHFQHYFKSTRNLQSFFFACTYNPCMKYVILHLHCAPYFPARPIYFYFYLVALQFSYESLRTHHSKYMRRMMQITLQQSF